ncbi:MAG: HK97-gp10 family putative phage morphogenesis protein, partial [Acidimicrobiia bacterium]
CRREGGVGMKDVTVDVSDMKRELDRAGDEILDALALVVKESAWAVIDDARHLVPVDTGNLRDSITYRSKGEHRAEVYIDTSDATYGHIVEFGTSARPEQPFMGPAAERERSQLKKRVVEEIERIARG